MLLQREKFAFLPEESYQKKLFPWSLILELELPPWYQFRDPLTIACSNILPASPGEIKFILIFISPNIVMTKGRKIFSTPPTSKYQALHIYMHLRAQVQRKNPKYCTFFGLQQYMENLDQYLMCKRVQVHFGYRLSLQCSRKNQKQPLIFPSPACSDNVQDWNQINGHCTCNRNHIKIINWQAWI